MPCSGQIWSLQSAPEIVQQFWVVFSSYRQQQQASKEESRVKYFNSPFSSRKTLDNLVISVTEAAAASRCLFSSPLDYYYYYVSASSASSASTSSDASASYAYYC